MPQNPELIDTTYYLNDMADPLTQVLMTYDDSDNYKAAYAYGLERFEVQALDNTRPESQDPLYYLYDGLGSVAQLTRPNGEVRDHYRYDEYGVPAPGAKLSEDGRNVNHNSFGYTGELWDEEDDLLYLRSRYYAPKTGRFMTRDAFPGFAANPLSMHKYAYVENDPVNYVDPLGYKKCGDDKYTQEVRDAIIPWEEQWNLGDAIGGEVGNTLKREAEQGADGVRATADESIRFMNKAYVADVILANGGGKALDAAAKALTGTGIYSHAAIYVGGGDIIQMQSGGIEKVSVFKFFMTHRDIDLYRYTDIQDDFRLRQRITRYAEEAYKNKIEYDLTNMVGLTKATEDEAICSELIWRAYESVKYKGAPIEIVPHTKDIYYNIGPGYYSTEEIVIYPNNLANPPSKLTKISHWNGAVK